MIYIDDDNDNDMIYVYISYVCIYICIYVHVCVYVYTYVCIYVYVWRKMPSGAADVPLLLVRGARALGAPVAARLRWRPGGVTCLTLLV